MPRRSLLAGLSLVALCACSSVDESADRAYNSKGVSGESVTPAAPASTLNDAATNPAVDTEVDNRSTFAIDVDTGSYTLARAFVRDGLLPDPAGVRTEEFVNYFDPGYPPPADGIAVRVDGTAVAFLGEPGARIVRVGLAAAEVDRSARPDAMLTFVIDVSGSMEEGGRLETVKQALTAMVGELRPTDQVGIVVYSDDTREVLPHTPVQDQPTILAAIKALQPEGSTNAEAGLRLGYQRARAQFTEGAINRVVLASDGVANVGQTGPDAILATIREAAGKGIDLVTVGVGLHGYNDALMEQLADDGDGFYAYVDGPREAERLFVQDLTGTLTVVARDAKVQVSFDPAQVATHRLVGYENRAIDDDAFRDDNVDGGEVGAGHTVTALYEVVLREGPADATGPLATATVRYVDPATKAAVERSAQLHRGDLAAGLKEADPGLHLDVLVAAYAEALRDGPWKKTMPLDAVATNARALPEAIRQDPDVVEFAELVGAAASLAD